MARGWSTTASRRRADHPPAGAPAARRRAPLPAIRLGGQMGRTDQELTMTTKADFTEEEWARLKRAPFVAGMAISLADPGGPIEAFKETKATLKTVLGDAQGGGRGELVSAIAGDVEADARQHKSPLAGFKPTKSATAGVEILDELGA